MVVSHQMRSNHMSAKYTHFKTYKRGVKRENGNGRLCMHCTLDATTTAILHTGKFEMTVAVCDDHANTMRDINAS
jgi:hypothetical protein